MPLDATSTGSAIPAVVSGLRRTFRSERTRSMEWRRAQLQRMRTMMAERENDILDALAKDMRMPKYEAFISVMALINAEIDHAEKHLSEWMRPKRVSTSLANMPASSRILAEPLGVVLIIGPWNYPVQLMLSPLVGAIAAGNCALLKPSEHAPASEALIASMIPQYLDSEAIKVVLGGVPETTAVLNERFDHIFFTGSVNVGRIVMQAAAKHLTPVTLELGGKSPCIVAKNANLDAAAKRIVWGKFYNAGQTCIAPDYILVDASVEAELVAKMKAALSTFLGPDPKQSSDYGRIIHAGHHARLVSFIKDGEVVVGGDSDENELYIAPTILRNVSPDSRIMTEEIFGPILPVLPVKDLEAAIEFVNEREKPLALYVFSNDSDTQDEVLLRTSSGGACVNDVVAHIGCGSLPFGGVGESGMGAYHGRASFDAFSHHKSILDKALFIEPPLRYAPYDNSKLKWARRLI
ncbi:MAG: aldehyde dehydrogenase family protein [Sandaracinaceae bacterium]|nr:aldehyde dehydrogenase family protein [Sandaracinaceae bacterium]